MAVVAAKDAALELLKRGCFFFPRLNFNKEGESITFLWVIGTEIDAWTPFGNTA